jgi:hypothetical protein
MKIATRTFVAVLVSSVASASLVDTATAHRVRWESKVRITDYADNASFVGKVTSERKACKARRRVAVWKRNPGAMDGPVDDARTHRRGIWAVYAPGLIDMANPGVYYATVKRRVLPSAAGHRHVCGGARSPAFRPF